jgi:hypothetical protein
MEPWVRALRGGDKPVCVRVSAPGDTGLLHVVDGRGRQPARQHGTHGAGPAQGGRTVVRRGQAGLAARRARPVALRDAVRDGWNGDAVANALRVSGDPTLW